MLLLHIEGVFTLQFVAPLVATVTSLKAWVFVSPFDRGWIEIALGVAHPLIQQRRHPGHGGSGRRGAGENTKEVLPWLLVMQLPPPAARQPK